MKAIFGLMMLLGASAWTAGFAKEARRAETMKAFTQTLWEAAMPGPSRVGVQQAARMLADERTLVLDVRTPEEYEAGHLERAVLIPLDDLRGQLPELSHVRDRTVLVYCKAGRRSERAAQMLRGAGFPRVAVLKGGFDAWKASGLPYAGQSGEPLS